MQTGYKEEGTGKYGLLRQAYLAAMERTRLVRLPECCPLRLPKKTDVNTQ